MPFCPQCRVEYRAGFVVCSDCGVPLTAALPALPPDVDNGPVPDWVPLARVTSDQVASMLREALVAQGIESEVISTTGHFGQIGMMGVSLYTPVGGAYTIMVQRGSYEAAGDTARVVLGDLWESCRLDAADEPEPGI